MSTDNVHREWDSATFNRGWVFQLSDLFCRNLPRTALYAISDNLMEWFSGWRPETFRALCDNLGKAFPSLPGGGAEDLAIRTLRSYGRGVVDYLHAENQPPTVVPSPASAKETLALPGGKILVTAHMGNWEVGGSFLGSAIGPFCLVGFPEPDAGVEAFRRRKRERGGHRTLIVGRGVSTPFHLRHALDSGESVVVLVDRAVGKDSVEVSFRGRKARFLKSPALLSHLTGCPVVPVAVMAEGGGDYTAYLGPAAAAGEDSGEAMQRAADFFGAILERYPDQWYNFFRYWREEA